MLKIPDEVQNRYSKVLKQKNIRLDFHRYYLKWLRFYLDFCNKYSHATTDPISLGFFQKN